MSSSPATLVATRSGTITELRAEKRRLKRLLQQKDAHERPLLLQQLHDLGQQLGLRYREQADYTTGMSISG